MEKMVKYHNYMNALDFKGFKSSDYDFLMYLCAQMRDHDEDVMSFSMNEIRNVTGFDYHASSAQFSDLKRERENFHFWQLLNAHFCSSF